MAKLLPTSSFTPSPRSSRAARWLLAGPLTAVLAAASCGGGGGGHGGAGAGGSGAGGAGGASGCPTTGTGNLTVTVTGLPVGLPAAIVVGGATSTGVAVTATQVLPLGAGLYTVVADKVIQPDPIVRTVYVPALASQSVCVGPAGAAVTVAYGAVPSSNKLWVATSGSADGSTPVAYTSAQLAASGAVPATVAVMASAGRLHAFDRDGSLWTNGGTVADATLVRLPAEGLGASGAALAKRLLAMPAIDCSPGVTALAFGKDGSLWVGSSCKEAIYGLSAAQVAAGGIVATPAATVLGAGDVQGLGFDKLGHLWASIGSTGRLLRYDALTVTSPAGTVPALTLTVTSGGTPLHPGPLAFDAAGNLWSNDFGGNLIYMLPAAMLASTTTSTITPPVVITLGVEVLLGGMAFDEGGGLWVAVGAGAIGRLSPPQLGVSTGAGMPTVPERIVTSASLGSAEDLAFYPAPASLPLFSALP